MPGLGALDRGTRQWAGVFIAAWSIVAGCALVLATSFYYGRRDLGAIIAVLAAPFLLGISLFLTIVVARIVSRPHDKHEVAPTRGTRASIHRPQRR